MNPGCPWRSYWPCLADGASEANTRAEDSQSASDLCSDLWSQPQATDYQYTVKIVIDLLCYWQICHSNSGLPVSKVSIHWPLTISSSNCKSTVLTSSRWDSSWGKMLLMETKTEASADEKESSSSPQSLDVSSLSEVYKAAQEKAWLVGEGVKLGRDVGVFPLTPAKVISDTM